MQRSALVHDLQLDVTIESDSELRADVAGWISEVDGRPAIRASKLAERLDDGRLAGIGVGYRRPYPLDAIAACARGRRHPAPDPDCTCGFHALQIPRTVRSRSRGRRVLLEVLFAGRVLVYDSDFGLLAVAERQHVLALSHVDEPGQCSAFDGSSGRPNERREADVVVRSRPRHDPGRGWPEAGGVVAATPPGPHLSDGGARLRLPQRTLPRWEVDALRIAPTDQSRRDVFSAPSKALGGSPL